MLNVPRDRNVRKQNQQHGGKKGKTHIVNDHFNIGLLKSGNREIDSLFRFHVAERLAYVGKTDIQTGEGRRDAKVVGEKGFVANDLYGAGQTRR